MLPALVLLAQVALANDTLRPVQLTAGYRVLGRGGDVGVLKNMWQEGDTLTVGEAMFAPAEFFDPWRKGRFQFGFSRRPHWLRLDLTDTIDRKLILELDNPYLSEVQFFQVQNGEVLDTMVAGSDHAFDGRRHWNFLDTIRLAAGDTVRCFIHIPYNRSQTEFGLYLWDARSRLAADKQDTIFLIVFFCLIFVYLLVLGIAIYLTRFRYFWFYFLYVLLVSGYIFADLGLGFQNIWPDRPYLQQVSLPVLTNAYLIAGTLFVLAHFHTKKSYPFHDQALRVVMYIAAGLIGVAFLMPLAPPAYAHLFSYFSSVMYIVTCLLFFWLAGTALARRDRIFPGWLMVGFLIHGLNVIYGSLESFRLVPPVSLTAALAEQGWLFTFHTPLILMFGLLVEMCIVLYIGMKRFKILLADSQQLARALALQRQQNLNALGMGMEAEQRRIAQELHDGLGGSISAVKFKLENLREKSPNNGGLGKSLDEITGDLASLHQELREIAHNLMPRHLHKHGLLTAVEQLIHRMESADGKLKIHFFNNANLENMSELARVYLFRIVQELLGNLFKHAQATEAWLQFVGHADSLLITLEDNGKGFDLTQVKNKGGIGLTNIRYRVEDALGGTFNIESAAGKGTVVFIEIPFKSLREGREHLFPKGKASRRERLKRLISGKFW